jgi:hypothetical protein
MKILKTSLLALTLCVTVAGASSAQAQEQGRHPAYLHALSDLRQMRAYLDRLTPSEHISDEQVQAIEEIDEAIREIKSASIDDHKNMRDHMPVDANITPSSRFHQAHQAGEAALHDLSQEEDNGFANGLKHRAIEHVEKANHIVEHIMQRYDRR